MVGAKYESGGIAKDGAKLVTAVATAQVPKFTVIIGGSFGAGNYGMCGRAYSPRQIWMWPNARILGDGRRTGGYGDGPRSAAMGSRPRAGPGRPRTKRRSKMPLRDQFETEGNPYHATARLWDDGIIDPLDTRHTLALGISAALNAPVPETRFGPCSGCDPMTEAHKLDIDARGVARVTPQPSREATTRSDAEVIAGLTDAFSALAASHRVRVVILDAEGPSFSAGADLNWMREQAEYDEARNLADARMLAKLMRVLNDLPKPTIARVQGPAYGGGVGLVGLLRHRHRQQPGGPFP